MSAANYRISNFANLFKQLSGELDSINNFVLISAWDIKANTLLSDISNELSLIEKAIEESSNQVSSLETRHSEKPFLKRIFGKWKEHRILLPHLKNLNEWRGRLDDLADQIQAAIDMTPNSPEEQKLLIKELKLHKKELQTEKKEVAAEMRAIRVDSRQWSARVTNYGFRGMSKYAAAERRQIRLNRERELAPHEDVKALIERQILHLERQIIWAEKLR